MNFKASFGCILCLPFSWAIPPNVVVIVIDDLGINNLGWIKFKCLFRLEWCVLEQCWITCKEPWRTSQVRLFNTSQANHLFYDSFSSGIILDRHYVHAACTPSRAALLTGKYAWKLGLQRGNIERYQPLGLGTKHKLMPGYLKDAGYRTHAVGKWHLGYCNNAYLPTRRGFDTFFGLYSDATHYRSR